MKSFLKYPLDSSYKRGSKARNQTMNTTKPGKISENIDGFRYEVLKNCTTGNCHLTLHALFNVTADKDSFIPVFFSTSKNFSVVCYFFSFFHSYVLPEISLSCASTKTHTQCTKSYRIKFVHPQSDKCAASHTDRHIYLYNRRHWQIYHRCVLSGLNAKALFFKWKV